VEAKKKFRTKPDLSLRAREFYNSSFQKKKEFYNSGLLQVGCSSQYVSSWSQSIPIQRTRVVNNDELSTVPTDPC
jgi:hypothetical protein